MGLAPGRQARIYGRGARTAFLTAYNSEGRPVAKWVLENAWPTKLEIGTLKSGTTQVLTESVTLVSEYMQRVAP